MIRVVFRQFLELLLGWVSVAEHCKRIEALLRTALPEAFAQNQIKKIEDGWEIVIGEDLLSIEVASHTQRICLAIQSPEVNIGLSREKLVLLMQYSSLWGITDGVYFCLDEDECPILMAYFNFIELNPSSMRSVIYNIIEKYSVWKDVVRL
jgi:hypothetical protein